MCISLSAYLYAQEDEHISIGCGLYKDTIGFLEPLIVTVYLENSSGKAVNMFNPWEVGLAIHFQDKSEGNWHLAYNQPYIPSDGVLGGIKYPSSFSIKKTLKINPLTNEAGWLPSDSTALLYTTFWCFFEGNYRLRVRYYPKGYVSDKPDEVYVEVEKEFFVRAYTSTDEQGAAEWLMKMEYPNFLFHQASEFPTGIQREHLSKAFLELFPRSSFAPYAHYSIALAIRDQFIGRVADRDIHYHQQIITHLEAAQSGTDNPWLLARVEPELQRHRQLLSSLRSRMEWEKKQQEKQKKDGNE
jgi:hypothetical protein